MLVSDKHKFVFTKTVKTAGTSVEMYFEPFCLPDDAVYDSEARPTFVGDEGIVGYRGQNRGNEKFYNHIAAKVLKKHLGEEVWEEYFKFTIIRNPYDVMISAFYHFEKSRFSEKYSSEKRSDIELFRTWLPDKIKPLGRSAYVINGEIELDYFIRYECMAKGIERVCNKLQLPFDLHRIKKTKSQHRNRECETKDFFDKKSRDLIEKTFDFEIRQFGYELV